jgi:AAA domain, putative AbiEii toxin, Type IV TA system
LKLTLSATIHSISFLTADLLPDFSVITGLNGSGKTHLLRGIENGCVLVDGISKGDGTSRFFDFNSIVPTAIAPFASLTLSSLRANTLNQISNLQNQFRSHLEMQIRGPLGLVTEVEPNFNVLDSFELIERAKEFFLLPESERPLYLVSLYLAVNATVDAHSTDANLRQFGLPLGLRKFAADSNLSIFTLDGNNLADSAIDLWGSSYIFQQNLGQLFVTYRDLHLANSLRKNKKSELNDPSITTFSSDEFANHYGQAPWSFVNEILEKAHLNFRINCPNEFSYDDFTPTLTKVDSGVVVPFEQLSSGEKVLMSFALCLYQAKDGRQAVEYPEILMLDEIDAPLHPSMVKDLIATIKDVLVSEKKIKVILTTHSPTTVAIAPEESIFVMSESRSLTKSSKDAALRLLTFGVPTLSISFDSRRQIFVESRRDAKIYDSLYSQIKSKLNSDRSLTFIAVSGEVANNHIAGEKGGCSEVKKLVNELSSGGNKSVLGLIDWDTSNKSTNKIRVLAEGRRYALENCILDPCLLAFLIIKENLVEAKKLKLIDENETYLSIMQADKDRIQKMVNDLVSLLEFSGSKVKCSYAGGADLELPEELLMGNGHAYAVKIINRFPFLNNLGSRAGTNFEAAVCDRIAENVAPDAHDWLPIEIQEVFELLGSD